MLIVMSSPPGFSRSRAIIASDASMPCTRTPRSASGSAMRPVPMPSSRERPPLRQLGQKRDRRGRRLIDPRPDPGVVDGRDAIAIGRCFVLMRG